MTNRRKSDRSTRQQRRYSVRGVRRDPPDISKLSKALLGLAMAEAERQAEADAARDAPASMQDRDSSDSQVSDANGGPRARP